MNSQERLREFLLQIWGEDPAKVFLARKPAPHDSSIKWEDREWQILPGQQWPDKQKQLTQWIIMSAEKGDDIYFSPALYKQDATHKKKADVLYSRVVWVDIDGDVAEALEKVASGTLPVPSWRVASGSNGSEHWYWVLDSPLYDTKVLEETNRRIAYLLGDKGGWSCEKVLRPPMSLNHKKGTADPVDIVDSNDAVYSLEDFDKVPAVRESIAEDLELGTVPSPERVMAKYYFTDTEYDIWENHQNVKDRSDAMVRLAYVLAEQNADNEEIYSLIEAFDAKTGKFVGRKDRQRRLIDIVQKVRLKYPFGAMGPMAESTEDTKFVYGLRDLLESDFKLEWLIEGLIPLKTINFISSPPGMGKSRLALQLADKAVRGEQFLDWQIAERVEKVMYLSFEMDGPMLKHFVESLSENKTVDDDLNERFMFVPLGNPIQFDKPEGFQFIETVIKDYEPDMVFIDALGKMTLDNLEEKQAKTINNNLQALISKYGVTFFIIHHNRKGESNKSKDHRPTMADVYGSQYVMTDAAVAFSLWGENQANMELVPIKTRAGIAPDPVYINGKKGFEFVVRDKDDLEEPEERVRETPTEKPRPNNERNVNGHFTAGF